MRRQILVLLALIGFGADRTWSDDRPRPNIVVILADDMGYGDAACFNPKSKIPTPNIDRLAAQGIRFTDAHATGSVCVPSRYGLLTGRFATRHPGLASPSLVARGPVIEPHTVTLPALMRDHGYETAMIGKWHLSFEGGDKFDYRNPLKGGPVDRGFEFFFGIHASTDIAPYFYIRGDRVPHAPSESIEEHHTDGWSPIQGAFWRGGRIAPDLKLQNVLDDFVRESEQWIARHVTAQPTRPFFLYVALAGPHTPWLPAKEFQGKSGAGLYGDFMMNVDDGVGRILNALERSQVADNTLVFFASDNGPTWYPQDVEKFGHDSAGGFRGMKGDGWEAGHRVPLIARWPGRIAPGTSSNETISLTDIMATSAQASGIDLPAGAAEDSRDLTKLFAGVAGDEPLHQAIVVVTSRNVITTRMGDWKLIPALGSAGFTQPAIVNAEPNGPRGQLYNLKDDPSETKNRWADFPEIVERLTRINANERK